MRVEKIASIHFFKTSCIGHLAQHAHDDGAIVIELINCTLINCIFTKWIRYFVKGSVTWHARAGLVAGDHRAAAHGGGDLLRYRPRKTSRKQAA
jgi:hypothetical protein